MNKAMGVALLAGASAALWKLDDRRQQGEQAALNAPVPMTDSCQCPNVSGGMHGDHPATALCDAVIYDPQAGNFRRGCE